MKNKMLIGSLLLTFILLLALLGPLLSPYNPYEIELAAKNSPPSLSHWFGTDELGRDLLIRACLGARISLSIGFAAALIDLVLGVFYGGMAAYIGGKVEEAMMRFADILYAFPYMLSVLVIMVLLDSGLFSILIAMTFIGWITMARIVRGATLLVKQQEYILASTGLGASRFFVIRKHILPNISGPIIVTTTLTIPSAIFTEAFLSFLGLGIRAPYASWGTMAHEGLSALTFYPWRLFFPAFLISLTMLSLNLIGDALKETYNKKTCYLK